jgi:hypothetical protein
METTSYNSSSRFVQPVSESAPQSKEANIYFVFIFFLFYGLKVRQARQVQVDAVAESSGRSGLSCSS